MKGQELIHKYFKDGQSPKAVYHTRKSEKYEYLIWLRAISALNPFTPCSELVDRSYVTVCPALAHPCGRWQLRVVTVVPEHRRFLLRAFVAAGIREPYRVQ